MKINAENQKADPIKEFQMERELSIEANKANKPLNDAAQLLQLEFNKSKYVYNFTWLGRPVLQVPQDLLAMQEIIWNTRPDYIIDIGIAHGGTLIFFASMLELLGHGTVIGLDIDIRAHNRREIENHPLSKRIKMLQGSSVSEEIAEQVKSLVNGAESIFVSLDSNHTHDHVLRELELYTPLISKDGYCVVSDTGIEDLPSDIIIDRPWGPGNNPKTAVKEFLKKNDRFIIDKDIEAKIVLTGSPDGFLKCIK